MIQRTYEQQIASLFLPELFFLLKPVFTGDAEQIPELIQPGRIDVTQRDDAVFIL